MKIKRDIGFYVRFLFVLIGVNAHAQNVNNSQYISKIVQQNTFSSNSGQWQEEVKFRWYSEQFCVSFLNGEVSFGKRSQKQSKTSAVNDSSHSDATFVVWNMKFVGANGQNAEGVDPIPSKFRHLSMENQVISQFQRLVYKDLYPFIDLEFYINGAGDLEYDWKIHPGANPDNIVVQYLGVDSLWVSEGILYYKNASGIFLESAPVTLTDENQDEKVVSNFELFSDKSVKFNILNYPLDQEIKIDPVIKEWGTFFYGTGLGGTIVNDVKFSKNRHIYLAGYTMQYFPVFPGVHDTLLMGSDAFLALLSSNGDSLLNFSYVGGSGSDLGFRIVLNPTSGEVIFAGGTSSNNMATSGAYKTSKSSSFASTGFLAGLSSDLTKLTFFTYLDEMEVSQLSDLSICKDGSVLIAGLIGSSSAGKLPITSGVIQPNFGGGGYDGYLLKINRNGTALISGTFIGGNSTDNIYAIKEKADGSILLAGTTSSSNFTIKNNSPLFNKSLIGGSDAFLMHIDSNFRNLYSSQLIGGSQGDAFYNIHLGEAEEIYLGGRSGSYDFPISSKAFQKSLNGSMNYVLMKLGAKGTTISYSTFLGGNGQNGSSNNSDKPGMGINIKDELWFVGQTNSPDFPVTHDAFTKSNPDSIHMVTVSKISSDGSALLYSSYLGGNRLNWPKNIDIVSNQCNSYVAIIGATHAIDFPVDSGVYLVNPTDSMYKNEIWSASFIVKFSDSLLLQKNTEWKDTLIKCNEFFQVLDGKNIGSKHFWNDSLGKRFHTVRSPGTYIHAATYGCDTLFDTAHIIRYYSPSKFLPSDTIICNNSSALLSAGNDSLIPQYKWSNADTTMVSRVFEDGTYAVLISTQNCGSRLDSLNVKFLHSPVYVSIDTILCDMDTFLIGENANPKYDRLYVNNQESEIPAPFTMDGMYSVRTENFCGLDSHSVNVIFLSTPADIYPDQIVECANTLICLNNRQKSQSVYQWKSSMNNEWLEDTTYCVGKSDQILCMSSNHCGAYTDTIKMLFTDPPTIQLDSVYLPCEGSSIMINPGINDTTVQYNWSSSEYSKDITVSKAGLYQLIASNSCGRDTQGFRVEFVKIPSAEFDPIEVCEGETIFLKNKSDGGIYFEWFMGDGTKISGKDVNHVYQETGNARTFLAKMYAYESAYCKDSTVQPITVHAKTAAAFQYQILGKVVHFEPVHRNANFVYTWYFGDGDTGRNMLPSHEYDESGWFDVCLTMVNGEACVDSVCEKIQIFGLGDKSVRKSNLVIFPNPAEEFIYIDVSQLSGIQNLGIFDMQGRMIFEIPITGESILKVDVSHLTDGVYFFELNGHKGVVRKKAIVRH